VAWYGLPPHPAKNLTRFVLAGVSPRLQKIPWCFGQVGTGLWFHITVPTTLSVVWLQLSLWVLIKLWHNQYVDCAVLAALSPPGVRITMRPIFVDSQWNNNIYEANFAGFRSQHNQYWSERNSESVRWKSGKSYTLYVLILSRYNQNSDTQLRRKMWGCNAGFLVVKPAKSQWPGFVFGKTRCNGPVPGWHRTQNHTGNLDPLLTLVESDVSE